MSDDRSILQTEPPRPPQETLPTMYDLPSEDPEEPGLPDEFHYLQPQLLSATLHLADYPSDRFYSVGDLNLYYDPRHPTWHKRPDWFLVVGVSRLYEQRDLRLSYVVWQEGVNPFVVVELLSPGTEKEDLGEIAAAADQPPPKWVVYEQILRVPYYVVFDRYTSQFRAFGLVQGRYQPLDLPEQRLWIPELKVGLGVWQGTYRGSTRQWLRWYDKHDWLPTDAEQERQRADQERQRAEQERQRADQAEQDRSRLIEQLRLRGIDPDELL